VDDDIVQALTTKICERWRFTIPNFREFPLISRTLLYKIITVTLGYRKFCARHVPKMLMGVHKTQKMASFGFDFLERYHKDGYQFLSHIVQ
jgi:hypothetical protein